MAVPAPMTGSFHMVFSGYLNNIHIINEVPVTPDAVFLNHIYSGLFNLDYLGFGPCGEDGCMPQPILCFEKVMPEEVIMGYMAIVTDCNFPVTAVHPGGILGVHHMAVYTSFWIVRKIGVGPGSVDEQNKNANHCPGYYNNRESPVIRRAEEPYDLSHSMELKYNYT